LEEVQIRLIYDDRIRIFSRDGRTTSLNFLPDGCPDLGPLLNNPELIVIIENINGGTTRGCMKNKEQLKLVELYENEEIHETDGWKKIWYESYPRLIMGNDRSPVQPPLPLLLRKCKPYD
jgi:hypothetical protein